MDKKFTDLNQLFSEIESDLKDNTPRFARYPVRIVFLNNFSSLQKLIHFISGKNITVLELGRLFDFTNDQWITPDEIVELIGQQSDSAAVVPLSEVLRFYALSDFQNVMNQLFNVENSFSFYKRIYVPLVGLRDKFNNQFWNNYHRREIGPPVWQVLDAETNIKIYQLNFKVNTDRAEHLYECQFVCNAHDWIHLWKNETAETIVSDCESIGYLCQNFLPDGIFDLEVIDNQKEYLSIMWGFHVPIPFSRKQARFWDSLLAEAISLLKNNSVSNFAELISIHFNLQNVNSTDTCNLLRSFFELNKDYSRWLLRYWIINAENLQGSYLNCIIEDWETYHDHDLIEKVWTKIFEIEQPSKIYHQERHSYLDLIHRKMKKPYHNIEDSLKYHLNNLKDESLSRIYLYLTNITYAERQFAIDKILQDNETMKNGEINPILNKIYPELYHYLKWSISFQNNDKFSWISDYFGEYNLCKLRNNKSQELADLLQKVNESEDSFFSWYYSLPSNYSHDVEENIKYIWIDALGAEWVSLVEYLINYFGKDKQKRVEKILLKRSNLPSVTKCNRFNLSRFSKLDEYVHNESPYKHPHDLIQQIELIKDFILEYIVEDYAERIAIVSDHGFTFLCQKAYGNFKKYDLSESHHEGRCMWIDQPYQRDPEFLSYKVDSGPCQGKRALISLKHTSLCDVPAREVHGGATPEEVIVPCIYISSQRFDEHYRISLITKEVSIKHPVIKVKISPKPSSKPALLYEGEKEAQLSFSEDLWWCEIKNFQPGTYNFNVVVEDTQQIITVKVKGGISEEELF